MDASKLQIDAGRLRHLLTLDGLSRSTLEDLLERAQRFVARPGQRPVRAESLHGQTVVTTFFEPSTRTRASFELAAQRLGADVLGLDVKSSSTTKGESVLDTFLTLAHMNAAAFVVRSAETGVPALLASRAPPGTTVVSGGESHVSHPTQGLLDALTIRQRKGDAFDKLAVAIVGDVRHSRVAASAISALRTLGVGELRLVGPAELVPADARAHRVLHDIDAGIAGCDVVMMLRIQKERMAAGAIPDDAEYHRRWGLTEARLARAKPDCIVMHPGPVNRDVELASSVMDGPRSTVLEQVNNGVAVRMAVLEALLADRGR